MGCMYYDYEFKTIEVQNTWSCMVEHTFENMELHYRKQMSMRQVLNIFKKTFKITPITIKKSNLNQEKRLAIYLLTKYSKEDFETIADQFNVSIETIQQIASTKSNLFKNEIKSFFKTMENDYLSGRKSSLAFCEECSSFFENYIQEDEIKTKVTKC